MRRLVVAALIPLLLLAGACGGSGGATTTQAKSATLADVKVTGSWHQQPHVTIHPPLSFASTESKTVIQGPTTGPAVTSKSTITVQYVAINASSGKVYASSWAGKHQPATFAVNQVISGFGKGLMGAHAGDRVVIAVAPKDGYDPVGKPSVGIHKGDSLVLVVDLLKVSNPLTKATGTPHPAPPSVPNLMLSSTGIPTKFTATPQTPKSVNKLHVYTVIKGHGPVVQAGQTVTVQYVGQVYPDGPVFDASWPRHQPLKFQVGTGQVIKGWDEGLVGQTVGSRVILEVPAALGYGAQGSGSRIPPNADLIFAIDILAAS